MIKNEKYDMLIEDIHETLLQTVYDITAKIVLYAQQNGDLQPLLQLISPASGAVAGATEITKSTPADAPKAEAPKAEIDINEVRTMLASKIQEGKKEQIKQLLAKFDPATQKLSGVDPKDYAALMEQAGEL